MFHFILFVLLFHNFIITKAIIHSQIQFILFEKTATYRISARRHPYFVFLSEQKYGAILLF